MDTRIQPPPRTTSTAPDDTAPRAGGVVLAAVIVTLVLSAAVLVSVLYGTGSESTPPRAGASPVQLEGREADEPATRFDDERQSPRSGGPPTTDEGAAQLEREVQRFRNAVDGIRRTTE